MAPRVALIALLLAVCYAHAGSYSVYPVKLALSETRPATTVRVRNTQKTPITVQVEIKHWVQSDGEDSLSETRDVIAVPPMFTVAPDKEQIVRVGLRQAASVDNEQAYRLILKEIPASTQPGRGLHLALNMSLPVFVEPVVPAAPILNWAVRRLDDGRLAVSVVNNGSGHFKFTQWRLLEDGDALGGDKKLQYLLPGARKQWTVQPPSPPAVGEKLAILVTSAGREQRVWAMVE